MKLVRTPLFFSFGLMALACGSSSVPEASSPVGPAAPKQWENPGGMWTPSQIPEFASLLKQLGLQIEPALLADPTSSLLQSIVSLGGCSASFVSPDGLIITNHHCVVGTLSYHSTPEKNLVLTGFLAKNRGEELWNGPAAKVWVTQKLTDVTEKMLGGLDQIADDRARYDAQEKRQKEIIAACEKDRPGIRCSLPSFYEGAQYTLIEQLEISDIRTVYAPADGVGNFGGDVDNWMWPRHGGDFAFYRAYVGPDGKPAAYAKENVPFKPANYLKIASKPLAPGDLVFVAGFPGHTNRLTTADDADDAVNWHYPRQIALFQEYLALIKEVGEKDKDAAIKAQSIEQSMSNYLKNNQGMIEGLGQGGVAQEKRALEQSLKAWIAADPERSKTFGDVFPKLEALHKEMVATRDRDAALAELRYASLLGAAGTIVRMAEERAKADADREPAFQERNWGRIYAKAADFPKKYNRTLDTAMFGLALRRALKNPEINQDWLTIVFGKQKVDVANIDARVSELYSKTQLEDEKIRINLLKTATTAQLTKSKDPLIQLALAVRPLQKANEDRNKRLDGAMTQVVPRYIAALRQHNDGPLAPDANGTLRISFGTVRGYTSKGKTEPYLPFTKLSEVVAKNQDKEPFDAPDGLVAAFKAGKFGPYKDPLLGEVPVDFLADLDITGGNSGSATLNARGEITGLAFDGNYEAMASDWVFLPKVTRSIHVDIRYVQWIMDAVDGADHLLTEMGVTPTIQ